MRRRRPVPFPLLRFNRRFLRIVLASIVACSLVLTVVGYLWGFRSFSLENGVLENLQLLEIAVALFCFIYAARLTRRLQRLFLSLGAAISLMMMQRELDFATFGEDHWFFLLHSNAFRIPFWTAVAVFFIVWAYRLRRPFRELKPLLRLGRLWPALLSLALIAASSPLELAARSAEGKSLSNLLLFTEELVEFNGYLVLVLVAVATARRARRRHLRGLL